MFLSNLSIVHVPLLLPLSSGITVSMPSSAYSDKNAIMIGLTGTPLIADDRSSKATFGNYYHKYYYNASIADGYTLKLIREDIA